MMKRLIQSMCLLGLVAQQPSAAAQYVGAEVYAFARPYAPSGYTIGDDLKGAYANPVSGVQAVGQSLSDAFVWNGPSGAATPLHPPNGVFATFGTATDGQSKVGFGFSNGSAIHALLWRGMTNSPIDLHPTLLSFRESWALGVGGDQQVGAAYPQSGPANAILWRGTSQSAVNLHPTGIPGAYESEAVATDGVQQVGELTLYPQGAQIGQQHAILWSGTAASAVDLHGPTLSSLDATFAVGLGGGQQVGFRSFNFGANHHALLWSGTADSMVDLHPTSLSQYIDSQAWATNGSVQVGLGLLADGNQRALAWQGTAASAVELHNLLPSGYIDSVALSIDHQGVVYGIGRDASSSLHLVKWTPAPEPATATLLASAALACAMTRYAHAIRRANY